MTVATIHSGIRWHDPALTAARGRGLVPAIEAIVRDYEAGVELFEYPDPSGGGRVRVQRGGIAVALGPDGTVLGFRTGQGPDPAPEAAPSPSRAGKRPSRPGKGPSGGTNPTTWAEVEAMLAQEGYLVVYGGTKKLIVRADTGAVVGSLPVTVSDSKRTLLNNVTALRARLGVQLRRPSA